MQHFLLLRVLIMNTTKLPQNMTYFPMLIVWTPRQLSSVYSFRFNYFQIKLLNAWTNVTEWCKQRACFVIMVCHLIQINVLVIYFACPMAIAHTEVFCENQSQGGYEFLNHHSRNCLISIHVIVTWPHTELCTELTICGHVTHGTNPVMQRSR